MNNVTVMKRWPVLRWGKLLALFSVVVLMLCSGSYVYADEALCYYSGKKVEDRIALYRLEGLTSDPNCGELLSPSDNLVNIVHQLCNTIICQFCLTTDLGGQEKNVEIAACSGDKK